MAKACYIRGIHATALSRIVEETRAYHVTFPSDEIKERLKIPPRTNPPDIIINDRPDFLGVIIEGTREDILDDAFPVSMDRIPESAMMVGKPTKYSVYHGVVTKRNDKYNYSHVLIDEHEKITGILPGIALKIGTKVTVQVQEPGSTSGKKKPVLARQISYPGTFVVGILEKKISYSRNITDVGLKSELFDIATSSLQPGDDIGLIFRSACKSGFMDDIKNEVRDISTRMREIQHLIDGKENAGPGLLTDPKGIHQAQLLFTKESHAFLDGIRGGVTHTMKNHHYWKVISSRIGNAEFLIDLVEFAMKQGKNNVVDQAFNNVFANFAHEHLPFPKQGNLINIMHYKPNGDVFKLKPGKIVNAFYSKGSIFDSNDSCITLTLKREFTPQPWHKSFYDGFDGLEINPGDYSTCHAKENFPILTNKYFRSDDTFLGCYYNISTPVQIFPGEVQYLDLEIDVVENEKGERKIIDQDKLAHVLEHKYISRTLGQKAMELAEYVLQGKVQDNLACDETFFK